jgi:outer membrane lipoprotein-sorting protein
MGRLGHPAALLLLAALGCARAPEGEVDLLAEVKAALAKREKKLQSFKFEGQTAGGPMPLRYEVAFKAPYRARALLTAPATRLFAFDGQVLSDQNDAAQKFGSVELDPGPDARLLLARVFNPFVPEGYRVPLLTRTGVTAKKVSAREVEVRVEAVETTGEKASVVYRLRWPNADFLGKRSTGPSGTLSVDVVDEHCERKLALCVPKKLRETAPTTPPVITTLSRIELNPPLPQALFELRPPPGYSLVEKPPETPDGM